MNEKEATIWKLIINSPFQVFIRYSIIEVLSILELNMDADSALKENKSQTFYR